VALWANLHASFPIALVLAGLFGLEALASAPPGERFWTGAKWALALLAALAATGATPYGYQPLLVFFNIVGSKELSYIDEWRPIPFDLSGVYGVAFIAGSLAIVAAARAGWTRAAPIALCGALMIMHVRFFPLCSGHLDRRGASGARPRDLSDSGSSGEGPRRLHQSQDARLRRPHSRQGRRGGDPTYADAILDRLVHNAHRIELAGESLRQTQAKQSRKA
jgi:IstB-like ATP binding protein